MLARFLELLTPRDGKRAVCVAGAGPDARPGNANMCGSAQDMAKVIQHCRDNNQQCWVSPCTFTGTRRTGPEAVDSRIIAIDIDLKPPKGKPDAPVFSSKAHAATEVQRAVSIGAPPPSFVVDSGGGLHLWFVFEDEFTTSGVKTSQYAAACEAVWDAYINANPAFGADVSRKADLAGLFRMPATTHLKDPNNPRPVQFYQANGQHLSTGAEIPNSFLANLPAPAAADPFKGADFSHVKAFDNGITIDMLAERIKVKTFKHVFDNCRMLQEYHKSHRGTVSYNFWRPMIRWTSTADDGRAWAHWLSDGHVGYNPADTDAKFDDALNDTVPPPLCSTVASELDPTLNICAGCPAKLAGCKWPHENPAARAAAVAASRPPAPAPQPSPQQAATPQPVSVPYEADPAAMLQRSIPVELDPAAGGKFIIDASHRTCAMVRDKNGITDTHALFDHAVWADRVVWNVAEMRYDLLFKASRIRNGKSLTREVEVPLRAITTDYRALASPFADAGIAILNVSSNARTWVSEFCVAEHQRVRDEAEASHAVTMGWQPDQSFVVAGLRAAPDGSVSEARTAGSLRSAAHRFERRGTVTAQHQMLSIYDKYGTDIAKFIIALSVGSPAHGINGKGAPLIVLTGRSGVGKTAVCRAAMSIWSDPSQSILTPRDTVLASQARAGIMQNLPVMQDEITYNEVDELAGMVHALSSGGDRASMTQGGVLRNDSAKWATVAMWTSNTSVVRQLRGVSYANDAVANRIMELNVSEPTLKLPDMNVLAALDLTYNANCGNLGVELARYYAANRKAVATLHEQHATLAGQIVPGGRSGKLRYWVQAVQAFLTGAHVLKTMGLMMLDQKTAIDLTGRLVQQAIGAAQERRQTADSVLREFMNQHIEQTVQITAPATKDSPAQAYVPATGRGAVVRAEEIGDRYRIQIAKGYFDEWLRRRGSQLSALMSSAYNEKLTTMTSTTPVQVDLYAGVNRIDRSGYAAKGFVAVPALEFSLPVQRDQIAAARTNIPLPPMPQAPAQVIPFPGGQTP